MTNMALRRNNQALTLMPLLEIHLQEVQAGSVVLEISARHLADIQVKAIYSRSCSAVPSGVSLAPGSAKVQEEQTLRHASTSRFWTPAKERL
jgi:hypothetical protein